jgi:hypothetical protein
MKNLYRVEAVTPNVLYIRDSDSMGKALKSALRAAKRDEVLPHNYEVKTYYFDTIKNQYRPFAQYIQTSIDMLNS